MPEIAQKYTPEQSKFESILLASAGLKNLDATPLDELYKAELVSLFSVVESNPYLDKSQKQKLHQNIESKISGSLEDLSRNLSELEKNKSAEVSDKKNSLYRDAVTLVTTVKLRVQRQLQTASDKDHFFSSRKITPEEFTQEVEPSPFIANTGIPKLDILITVNLQKENSVDSAVQAALKSFFDQPANCTIFNIKKVESVLPRFLKNLKIPFHTNYLEVAKSENLRSGDYKIIRKLTPGEVFQITPGTQIEKRGKYEYVAVEDSTGRKYRICINDNASINIKTYGVSAIPLQPKLSSNTEKNIDLQSKSLQKLIYMGFALPDGTLTEKINGLTPESIVPWDVREAIVVLSGGEKVFIKREQGKFFTFSPQNPTERKRVRLKSGDILMFPKVSENIREEKAFGKKASIPASVQANIGNEKKNWQVPNIIPREKQQEAVCAAFVQLYLEGVFGHDFMKKNGLIDQQQKFQDAWAIAPALEQSGYGRSVLDFSHFFQVNPEKEQIFLDKSREGYARYIELLFQQASLPRAQFGLMLFHYKHTRANASILKTENSTLNSHVTVLLGLGTREFITAGEQALSNSILGFIQDKLGGSYDNSWQGNKGMLRYLKNVRYNERQVTYNSSDNEFYYADTEVKVTTEPGGKVRYDDIQISDFYHNSDPRHKSDSPARMMGLTEIMIQGNFEPVKLLTWNEKKVDIRMSGQGEEFIIGSFEVDANIKTRPEFILRIASEYGKLGIPPGLINEYTSKMVKFLQYRNLLKGESDIPPIATKISILDWKKKPTNTVNT